MLCLFYDTINTLYSRFLPTTAEFTCVINAAQHAWCLTKVSMVGPRFKPTTLNCGHFAYLALFSAPQVHTGQDGLHQSTANVQQHSLDSDVEHRGSYKLQPFIHIHILYSF